MGGGGGCCVGDFHCCVGDFSWLCFWDSGGSGSGCCVGDAPGPSASEKHAQKVANELAEMKEKMGNATSEQENKIMDYINRSMNTFIREIDDLNKKSFDGESLSINITAIKEKNEALKRQVVGCVGNVMNQRLVQTDRELSVILEERDDKKRKKNFESFVERIKSEALEKFRKEVEKAVKEQSKIVADEIKARQKEVNRRLEESINELTAIMEVKKESSMELERKQIEYMYQSSLCDLLLREAEG